MATSKANARFWQWHNDGWVKLTLRPGQRLSHFAGGMTSEGPWNVGNTWEYVIDDGEPHLLSTLTEWGSDCDGPHEYGCTVRAELDQLDAWQTEMPGEIESKRIPEWQRVEAHQRDVFAEMAGY